MELIQWIQLNDAWLAGIGIASAVMFIASLILFPVLIVRLPADYFVASHRHWLRDHPAFIPFFIIQNLIGIILLASGVIMLVLPGQGLLTIVLGISVMSFPGKHRLMRHLFRRKRIHRPMNWIRLKAKTTPFIVPPAKHESPRQPPDR